MPSRIAPAIRAERLRTDSQLPSPFAGEGTFVADPIVGLLIAAAILVIVWQSGKTVFTRLLDGVDPDVIEEIRHTAQHVPGVEEVAEVRARWLGHRLRAEVNVAVSPDSGIRKG